VEQLIDEELDYVNQLEAVARAAQILIKSFKRTDEEFNDALSDLGDTLKELSRR